jgi:hypothetical protein
MLLSHSMDFEELRSEYTERLTVLSGEQ